MFGYLYNLDDQAAQTLFRPFEESDFGGPPILDPGIPLNYALDLDHQRAMDSSAAAIGSDPGAEWTQLIIIPAVIQWNVWDDDHQGQKPQDPIFATSGSDAGSDWNLKILLPPNVWDDDAREQRSNQAYYGSLASDSGQDTTNFLILPPLAEWEALPPDWRPANGPVYVITGPMNEDEFVGVPIAPPPPPPPATFVAGGRMFRMQKLQKLERL